MGVRVGSWLNESLHDFRLQNQTMGLILREVFTAHASLELICDWVLLPQKEPESDRKALY